MATTAEHVEVLTPVELLQRLLRFRTVNPPGAERECLSWLEGMLRSAGLDTRMLADDPERPNLVARLTGRGVAPPLLMHGHVDVVPTDGQRWRHPPFAGIVADGHVWGRGALDMKGGVAMMVSALLNVARPGGLAPAGDVILALMSDEEAGGTLGARFLTEQHAGLFDGTRHAIGEFGAFTLHLAGRRFYPIQVAEKQLCTLRMHLRGSGGHGALSNDERVTLRLAEVLQRLDRRLPVHVHPIVRRMLAEMSATLPTASELTVKSVGNRWLGRFALRRLGPLGGFLDPMLRNTVSPNVIRVGEQFNVVPAEASMLLDGRVLPGLEASVLLRELAPILGDGVTIEVVRFEGSSRSPDLDLLGLFSEILRDCDPQAIAIPFLLPATTDGRFFERIGIQHYGFLPMRLPPSLPFSRLVHGADERIPVDALMFGVQALDALVLRYRG